MGLAQITTSIGAIISIHFCAACFPPFYHLTSLPAQSINMQQYNLYKVKWEFIRDNLEKTARGKPVFGDKS